MRPRAGVTRACVTNTGRLTPKSSKGPTHAFPLRPKTNLKIQFEDSGEASEIQASKLQFKVSAMKVHRQKRIPCG